MPDTIRCPDCGHDNPAGSESCSHCNFPLARAEHVPGAKRAPSEAGSGPRDAGPAAPIFTRPIRPRRPRPASNQALTLWLTFAVLASLVVIFIAVKATYERASVPVEGSSAADQQQADELRAALEKDSTNVDARVGLADILYNTGNWSDAIVHYRSAVHHDSSRASAIVDLGVCYYNLSTPLEAERLFKLALTRDPHQPVALFNLGIVNEQRSEFDEALKYFHRALQSEPHEEMRQPIMDAMQRIMTKLGKTAPPLPDVQGQGAAPPGGR